MAILRSLAFYIVFYGGSFVLLVATFLALALPKSAIRTLTHAWCKLHRWSVEVLLGIEVVVEGHRETEPVLYAVKHESFFEAIDAPMVFDLPVPFAKAELFRIPLWGRAALAYGMVPVDRARGAVALRHMLAEAKRYSAQGRPLIIFPEGTRVPHGERHKLQSGFAGLYKMLGLPVVPVAVESGPTYHRLWKRRGRITYRFGDTIPAGLPRAEMEGRVQDAINALNS